MTTTRIDAAPTDLDAMFGLKMDGVSADIPQITHPLCPKCSGRGKFVGNNGRVIGNCFSCNGTGLSRSAGVALAADNCVKCVGTGEWRTGRPCFACHGTGKIVDTAAVDVSAIATAFEAARMNSIKRPKLRLADFIFSRAPDTGRNAGSIYVTRDGEYLGRVTDGQFHRSMACDAPTEGNVIEVASNPHAAAKAYGQRTGGCSCCGRELTNGESIDLGIGPICRDKFGWG